VVINGNVFYLCPVTKSERMLSLDGSYPCAIDDRGRVRLPARLLEALGEEHNKRFFVNRGLGEHNFLRLFPKSLWEQEVSKLRANLNPYDQEQVEAIRFFFNGAEEVEVDKVERIRIPKMLLEWIDVRGKDQLVINAFLDFIEIWKADEYARYIEQQKHDEERKAKQEVLSRLARKEPPTSASQDA